MVYSCREIIEATGGALIRGTADGFFEALSTDSREDQAGKLFIPLKGQRFDGHSFLAAAVKSGATGLLLNEGEEERLRDIGKDVAVIRVSDTLAALGAAANFWRKKFTIPVAAITGSAGKTTTKEMTAQIMGRIKNTLKTEGNFNNLIGLPLTLLRLREEHEVAILEMGTNVPGEIGRLSRIACPDVGLITNIGPAHLEGLKSLDIVREEKGELFRNLSHRGIAIVNNDDEAVRALAGRWSGDRVTYGFAEGSDITARDVLSDRQGLSFTLRIGNWERNVATAALNVKNALAAAATAWALGAVGEVIGAGLEAFKPIPGRMEITRLRNGAYLIDDSYNANPLSVREALTTLSAMKGPHRSTVILGDMLELGSRAGELHEEIGQAIAVAGIDVLYVRGLFAEATAAGARRKGMPVSCIHLFLKTEEIVNSLSATVKAGDWVLVKGSRAAKMEDVVAMLTGIFGIEGDSEATR